MLPNGTQTPADRQDDADGVGSIRIAYADPCRSAANPAPDAQRNTGSNADHAPDANAVPKAHPDDYAVADADCAASSNSHADRSTAADSNPHGTAAAHAYAHCAAKADSNADGAPAPDANAKGSGLAAVADAASGRNRRKRS